MPLTVSNPSIATCCCDPIVTKHDTAPQEANACGRTPTRPSHEPRMMVARDRCHAYIVKFRFVQTRRMMGRLTGREPVVTEVGSVRSEWLGQVQLDGEKDWRTAGGRRS